MVHGALELDKKAIMAFFSLSSNEAWILLMNERRPPAIIILMGLVTLTPTEIRCFHTALAVVTDATKCQPHSSLCLNYSHY